MIDKNNSVKDYELSVLELPKQIECPFCGQVFESDGSDPHKCSTCDTKFVVIKHTITRYETNVLDE